MVAHTTMKLVGLEKKLGIRASDPATLFFEIVGLPAVHHGRGAPGQQTCGLQVGLHLDDVALDRRQLVMFD